MASSQRTVEGYLYVHGGQTFAFLDTEQPYDLGNCAELNRRALHASGPQLGRMELRLIESPDHPTQQGFAVLCHRRGVNRQNFEAAVRQIFHGARLDVKWVTNFRQHGGQLFLALIARQVLDHI